MTSPTTTKATAREWIGLAVIALPCMVYAMDLTILNLAIPTISAELKPSASQLLWIIDIYGFLVAGFLITMGTLGDRIGRRKLLLIGAVLFLVASVLAAFSNDAETLIAMRALLGIAGATVAPSTLSLIRNMFHDERERQLAIGLWVTSFSVGGAIGPLVGGLMLEWFWWGAGFLIAVPVMVLLLALGPFLLPEYKDPDAGTIDPPSVVLSLSAVLSTIYGIKRLAELGVDGIALVALIAGLALGYAFTRRQRTLAYPLLDLQLFQRREFAAAVAVYALSCMAMFGVYIYVAQYLQLVLGLSPWWAGVATVPWSLAFVVGSLAAPWLAQRASMRQVFVAGLAAAAAGTAVMGLIGGEHGLAAVVLGSFVMSLGMAPVFTLGNEIILTTAPPERAGAASAISETSAEFSGAVGIALFGSLGTWLYRTSMQGATGSEWPAAATGTLGGAVGVAPSLDAAASAAMLDQATSAFIGAMQWVVALCVVLMLVGGWVAARMIPRR